MTDEQRDAILRFVRQTAEETLEGRKAPAAPAGLGDVPYGGLFVTLRDQGRLRGCMGLLAAQGSLPEALVSVTCSSLHDPRFTREPVTQADLPNLDIEVSVLGPVRRVNDPRSLVAGRHGVVISRQGRSGCFLPQVATEQGWDLEEFLTQCCEMKAGLPGDAWQAPDTRIEAFEVEAIKEKRPRPGQQSAT